LKSAWRLRCLVAALAVGCLAPAVARSAGAGAGRSPAGEIAFQANVGGVPQIFVVGAGGGRSRQLTRLPLGAEHPSFSPDGKAVVFVRNGVRRGFGLIYRIGLDGSGLRRLSPPCGGPCLGDADPVYSRDGATIAFERFVRTGASAGGAIFTIKADGSQPSEVTRVRPKREDHEPQWLPDGMIAFTRILTRGPDTHVGALFEIDPQGTRLRQLNAFSRTYANDARWSPDGTMILFDSYPDGVWAQPVNVYTMHPNGSDRKQLTHYTGTTTKGFVGAWSPNGAWIVWHRSAPGRGSQLFIMNANGGRARHLTNLPAGSEPEAPAWGIAIG
jgi:Tol biopolymer transport system component